MEPWSEPVISGLFSLAVVIAGALLIGLRERNQRADDQEREDKNSQRQAVAAFLRAQRDLDGKLMIDTDAIDPEPDPATLRKDQLTALTILRGEYFNNLLRELEVLDLYLHDGVVREKFEKLHRVIKGKWKLFLTDGQRLDQLPAPQTVPLIQKLIIDGIASEELREARDGLIEAARTRLRLAPAGGDEYPGMFTPVE